MKASGDTADLHVHSNASDGLYSPDTLLRIATERGLAAIAISDHDTTAGVESLAVSSLGPLETISFGSLEVVPALEVSSEWEGRELHVLGYFVPLFESPLRPLLTKLREGRRRRLDRVLDNLAQIGLPVQKSRVLGFASGQSVGRPHIGSAMVEAGYVKTIGEAFDKYLGRGRPAYAEREHIAPAECVRAIKDSGGVPVWAHPGTTGADHLLPELVKEGLAGIEVNHPKHDPAARERYAKLAQVYDLCATGGSDFHGQPGEEDAELGSVTVHYSVIDALRRRSTLA